MYQPAAGAGSQLKLLGGDPNVLKSSLEEMVDDFLAWKSQNKIPAHPLVTVIVATYNHEKYVREAIDSVIMQKTDFDFEIVAFAGFNFDVAPFIDNGCALVGLEWQPKRSNSERKLIDNTSDPSRRENRR